MSTLSDFLKTYQHFKNFELLQILDKPGAYQPLAVEAASQILSTRGLSPEEMDAARREIARLKRHEIASREEEKLRAKQFKKKVVSVLFPVPEENPPAQRLINYLFYLFAAILVFRLYNNIRFFIFLLKEEKPVYELSSYLVFIEPLLLLISIPFYFARRRVGWFFFATFLFYSLILATGSFFVWRSFNEFVSVVFYLGILAIVCKQSIRDIFKIRKEEIKNAVVSGLAIAIVMLYFLSYK